MSNLNPEAVRPASIKDSKVIFNDRPFGDDCLSKNKETMRFMFQNVNGLSKNPSSVKMLSVRDSMYKHDIDVMMMAETNLNWGKMRRTTTLPQIARRWFQTSKTVVAYNQHEKFKRKSSIHQPGGTAIVSKGEMALRVCGNKYDNRRLGRWSSQVYQGKQGITTRAVSVYVPNKVYKHGCKKVWCQQQNALLRSGITENVLDTFWNDFWRQIDEWVEKGEQLIISGDWNCKVSEDTFLKQFLQRNLIPVMSSRFGKNLPPTHNNGSYAIDEIFVSSTLQIHAAGYLEHGSSLSDHCPLWFDITKNSMIGFNSKLKPTYASRKLKNDDPRVVSRYLIKLQEILEGHNVFERLDRLFQSINHNQELLQTQADEYEEMDKIRTLAMKTAEKHCRKLKVGAVKWSPQIQAVRDKIEYLALSKRKKLGRKVGSKMLLRLSKKTKLSAEFLAVEDIEEKIDQAFSQYRILKLKQQKLREDFITALATALEKKGKGKRASIVKQLIAKETQREMWRKIAVINEKVKDLSTKFVTVNTPNGKKIINEKKQLEHAIIKENKAKYHQTEGTCPFFKPPLKKDFGHLGKGPKTQAVLEGTYQPNFDLSPQTKDFIKLCCLPKGELVKNPLTRSLDYFNESWKKMREQTASRDIHFGHYKAATETPNIMQFHYQLAEIPFRTGYSPQRWKKATNVMILKKENNTDVDKLRTLVLFECDFNHNNKFLGRSMMEHMKTKEFNASEQYSAPGKKCIDHVLNRKLFFDLVRYKKNSAAMAAVDLKSCYDRVTHSPANLAMQSFGIPPAPIESMFQSIQDMEYHTMTFHGISEDSFGGKEKGFIAAPNGLGQGNGAGPAVWSVVSTKMFQVLHERGAATKIISPITKDKIDLCGFAFVDDSDLIAMSSNKNDPADAKDKMQNVVNQWEAVSKTTGGALSPEKCWSWIISFDWKQDNWKYSKVDKVEQQMTVKDHQGKPTIMKLLQPNEAQEMLGVRLAPDGNQQDQVQAMKEKMNLYAERVRTGHLNRHEAWISLTMVTMKAMEYMMPAMTLSPEEYNDLMKPILKQFLPKMGINRNIPRALLYAPTEIQGFNLKDPYILQGAMHIRDISEHLWKDTMTGKLLKNNLEQLRLELGCNINILESDYGKYKHLILTDSFISKTWEFMSNFNVELKENTAIIPMLRENDKCIMEAFIDNKQIKREWLPTLNKCRIYLQAFSLSDIVTGNGQFIRDKAWHGRQEQTGRDLKWPKWGRPSMLSWNTWRSALQLTFCQIRDKKLHLPLKRWIQYPKKWQWYHYNRLGYDLLVQRTGKELYAHSKVGRSYLHKRYSILKTELTGIKTQNLIPVSVKETKNALIMESSLYKLEKSLKPDPNLVTKNTDWLNIERFQKGSAARIAKAITKGTAIAVSDGSYKESRGVGTASWVISSKDKQNIITAGALSPGSRSIQSSYRSEMVGLLGVLNFLKEFCDQRNITSGRCNIFCDGLSALQVVKEATTESVKTTHSSCDIISACAKLKEVLPIQLTFQHVKAHQDENTPITSLPVPAQLNVLMDKLAKDLNDDSTEQQNRNLSAHPLSLALPIHNHIIYEKFLESIYNSIATETGHNYWLTKGRYTPEQRNIIDWHSQSIAMKPINKTRQRSLSKWFSGWVATGKNMKRWQLRYASNCPFCGYNDEDTAHILQCQHPPVNISWKTLLDKYDKKLAKQHTNFNLRKAIIQELRAWRNNTRQPTLSFADEKLKHAILTQRTIGWKVFLEGLVTVDIINYQKEFHQRNTPDRKFTTWIKRVYNAGWNLIHDMWTHRNEVLHKPENIDLLNGKEILDKVITKELELGIGELPTFEFTHLFRSSKETILNKSLEGRKDWLATVKLGRKMHNDKYYDNDEFDDNKALSDWIGLTDGKG